MTDKRWTFGVNNAASSRTFRVVAPLSYVLDIFMKADLQWYTTECGICCHWEELDNPYASLYHVKSSGLFPVEWIKIGGPWVEIKSIELELNYTKHMYCYQMLQIKAHGLTADEKQTCTRSLLDDWVEIITSTKQAQMQVNDETQWPPRSHLPWTPHTWQEMPIVVWLRRQW